MTSRIRKIDDDKLNKYLRIINRCYSILLIALMAVMIFSFISAICMAIDGLEMSITEPILAVFSITAVALIFDSISKKISQELSRRKDERTIEILTIVETKKIKLKDFENIDFGELLKDAEMEAEFDDKNNVIYVTFFITGDDNSTKISKKIKFEKDEIVSQIEII